MMSRCKVLLALACLGSLSHAFGQNVSGTYRPVTPSTNPTQGYNDSRFAPVPSPTPAPPKAMQAPSSAWPPAAPAINGAYYPQYPQALPPQPATHELDPFMPLPVNPMNIMNPGSIMDDFFGGKSRTEDYPVYSAPPPVYVPPLPQQYGYGVGVPSSVPAASSQTSLSKPQPTVTTETWPEPSLNSKPTAPLPSPTETWPNPSPNTTSPVRKAAPLPTPVLPDKKAATQAMRPFAKPGKTGTAFVQRSPRIDGAHDPRFRPPELKGDP